MNTDLFVHPCASILGFILSHFIVMHLLLLPIQNEELQCSVAPVGALHPVQGLLERFEVGPGCAARESGNKETHVIAVGRVTNSPDNKVTIQKVSSFQSDQHRKENQTFPIYFQFS